MFEETSFKKGKSTIGTVFKDGDLISALSLSLPAVIGSKRLRDGLGNARASVLGPV